MRKYLRNNLRKLRGSLVLKLFTEKMMNFKY